MSRDDLAVEPGVAAGRGVRMDKQRNARVGAARLTEAGRLRYHRRKPVLRDSARDGGAEDPGGLVRLEPSGCRRGTQDRPRTLAYSVLKQRHVSLRRQPRISP